MSRSPCSDALAEGAAVQLTTPPGPTSETRFDGDGAGRDAPNLRVWVQEP